MKNNRIKKINKKGFTLLFAVLISSVALSVGISIFNISIKELKLSTSARESQFALYASDTGIDCAIFWDLRGTGSAIFPTSTQSVNSLGMNCMGSDITASWDESQQSANSATTTFTLQFSADLRDPCVDVEVVKNFNLSQETRITSRGYNTCIINNERRTERAIRVIY